jgi:hypothetical protein
VLEVDEGMQAGVHQCFGQFLTLVQRDRRVVDIAKLIEKSPDALTVSVASFYMSYPLVLRGDVGAPLPGKPKEAPKGGVLFGEKTHPDVTHNLRKVGGLRMA